jgi:predicted nucleic acid-binding protein
MTEYYPFILIDTGIIVAFYNKGDRYHQQVVNFFANCSSQLITTVGCITETMWLLAPDVKVQTEFLSALEKEVFIAEQLLSEYYQKIKQLNQIYQDLPADFTDLSLIAISERLNIPAIATLDKDFDIYRRYRNQFFIRVFYPQ